MDMYKEQEKWMKLAESIINEEKNFVDEDENGNLPKKWEIENYGNDDAGGKGLQMGQGDVWKEARDSIPSNCFGFAVDNGTGEYVFYSAKNKFRDEVVSFLNSCEEKWEYLEDYRPEDDEDYEDE